MDKNEKNSLYLSMYDVRGIQDYIFRTNRIVDIMGASGMIEDIILEALRDSAQAMMEEEKLLFWEEEAERALDKQGLRILCDTDSKIKIQVLYVGGGNAFVLFRGEETAHTINRRMARYVLEHTYSLQLAAAVVPYTGNYKEDFGNVRKKMSEIKGSSPVARLTGALPIAEIEEATGFPAAEWSEENGRREPISIETQKKRERKRKSPEGEEKYLDSLITEKGVDSMVAIVHIDGNNMGQRILHLMRDETDYTKAIDRIRMISININHGFKETFETMKREMETRAASHPAFKNKKNKIFVRKLLVAGDDITFICNARIALAAVEFFSRDISDKVICQEEGKERNTRLYGFSVCAGIAYMNSHFPFRTGYEAAEKCCDDSAKKRAKQECYQTAERLSDDNGMRTITRTGNWVDFQICRSVQAAALEEYRRDNYQLYDGSILTLRPYYIAVKEDDEMNEKCSAYDFSIFKKTYEYFGRTVRSDGNANIQEKDELPRSLAQRMKTAYSLGGHEVDQVCSFARSRGKKMVPEYPEPFRRNCEGKQEAVWYDALEMLDYYINLGEEKTDDKSGTDRNNAAE